MGAGYFDVRDAIGQRTRLVNLSYSLTLWRNISLYASANREIGGDGYSSQLQISIPFDARGTANVSTARDAGNRWSERVAYSRAAPTDGGFGWNGLRRRSRQQQRLPPADLTAHLAVGNPRRAVRQP